MWNSQSRVVTTRVMTSRPAALLTNRRPDSPTSRAPKENFFHQLQGSSPSSHSHLCRGVQEESLNLMWTGAGPQWEGHQMEAGYIQGCLALLRAEGASKENPAEPSQSDASPGGTPAWRDQQEAEEY